MIEKDLTIGRTYIGAKGAITLLSVTGRMAQVRKPISMREFEMPASDLVAHANSSPLRAYHHKKTGEMRTKLRVDEKGKIVYQDAFGRFFRVTEKQWAKWRERA